MLEKYQEVERSIITKFRKDIWRKFMKAVRNYQLVEENDKIAVCISGGKDSFLLAKCMEELKQHGSISFELVYFVMDPEYKKDAKRKIEENAKLLNISVDFFSSHIFDMIETQNKKGNPCYLCARKRRGFLYQKAKDLGCNKIALGHHFDDVIETILLSIFYGGEYKSMPPKLHSTNFKGMELIRPLYLVREKDILSWAKYNHLSFINCACKMTENKKIESLSKRLEVKNLISKLEKVNPNVASNIFKSSENVSIDTLLAIKQGGVKTSFLEHY